MSLASRLEVGFWVLVVVDQGIEIRTRTPLGFRGVPPGDRDIMEQQGAGPGLATVQGLRAVRGPCPGRERARQGQHVRPMVASRSQVGMIHDKMKEPP